MAASQVSCIKMRWLLYGVILGLLAVVHSSPAHTATQNHNEDEVIREAATDGFLVDNRFLPSGAPDSPGTNVTAPQRPTSDAAEGSGGETDDVFAALRIETTVDSRAPSAAPAEPPTVAEHSGPEPPATRNSPSGSTFDLLSRETFASGSGDGEMLGQDATASAAAGVTSSSATETSVASSTSEADLIGQTVAVLSAGRKGSGDGLEEESGSGAEIIPIKHKTGMFLENRVSDTPNSPQAPSNAGGTPAWMIIAGFIVGLAALVILLVAIATRESWNGPTQTAQLEGRTDPSTQQRELETFLHKEVPRENGHASEYTVIPLEELTEKYPSH